jgi:predicted DNA-binding protein (MmcQ/YjbR family)
MRLINFQIQSHAYPISPEELSLKVRKMAEVFVLDYDIGNVLNMNDEDIQIFRMAFACELLRLRRNSYNIESKTNLITKIFGFGKTADAAEISALKQENDVYLSMVEELKQKQTVSPVNYLNIVSWANVLADKYLEIKNEEDAEKLAKFIYYGGKPYLE